MRSQKTECRELFNLYTRLGARPRIPVYMGEELMAAPIEDLELSVRSFNCLRRAGLFTVGELVSSIEGRDDLLRIRNLGARSAEEIMQALMQYQYLLLPERQRGKYLKRMVELNAAAESHNAHC